MLYRMISYIRTLIYRVCYDVIANSNVWLNISGDVFRDKNFEKNMIKNTLDCHALLLRGNIKT